MTTETVAKAIRDLLATLNAVGRVDALALLRDEYCFSCGDEQPPKTERRCQCWNDE